MVTAGIHRDDFLFAVPVALACHRHRGVPGVEKTPAILAGYFIASFALGIASYYLIEKPLRRTRLGFGKSLFMLLVVPAIAFSALHSAGKSAGGWMERFGNGPTHILPRLKASEIPQRGPCLGGASDGSDSSCVLGQANASTTALLMGDSYSNHFWGFIDILAKDANLSVMAQGSPGCLALPDVYLYDWWKYKNTLYKKCHDAAAEYHKLIARSHYDYVIIGLTWETYANSSAVVLSIDDQRSQALSRERMKAALLKSLDIIERSGARPVLIKSNIVMPEGANDCLYRSIKLRGTIEEHHCATSVAQPEETPGLRSCSGTPSRHTRTCWSSTPRTCSASMASASCRSTACRSIGTSATSPISHPRRWARCICRPRAIPLTNPTLDAGLPRHEQPSARGPVRSSLDGRPGVSPTASGTCAPAR